MAQLRSLFSGSHYWLLLSFGLFLGVACQSEEPKTNPADSASGTTGTTAAELDTITVTGTLLDATCHSQADAAPSETPVPLDCEGDYVSKGYPVGLRTEGEVWLLSTVPQALADYLTSTARIRGAVRSEGVLIPIEVEVRRGDTWTTVM